MATYIELHTLRGSESIAALRQKISVAIAIKANALAKAAPNATQKVWAKAALAAPEDFQDIVLNYILAEYSASATSAITGATDAQVQTAVNAAVTTLLEV